jgi:hypothetical protein
VALSRAVWRFGRVDGPVVCLAEGTQRGRRCTWYRGSLSGASPRYPLLDRGPAVGV